MSEKKPRKLSPKAIKYGIGGCIAIALVAYIVITALPEKQPTENDPNATTSSVKLPPDLFPDDQGYGPSNQTNDTSNPNPTSQGEASDPESTFKADKVVLTAGLDANEQTILACYVDRPIGYLIDASGTHVTLWPEEMRLDATDEKPLSLSWSNVLFLDEMVANDRYDDPKTGTYELIDSYEYEHSDDKTAKVYITKYTPNNNDSMMYHMISVGVKYGSSRPSIRIFDKDMSKFLSTRYPDIQSLARAIFVPINRDEPEPTQEPTSTQPE